MEYYQANYRLLTGVGFMLLGAMVGFFILWLGIWVYKKKVVVRSVFVDKNRGHDLSMDLKDRLKEETLILRKTANNSDYYIQSAIEQDSQKKYSKALYLLTKGLDAEDCEENKTRIGLIIQQYKCLGMREGMGLRMIVENSSKLKFGFNDDLKKKDEKRSEKQVVEVEKLMEKMAIEAKKQDFEREKKEQEDKKRFLREFGDIIVELKEKV